MRRFLVTFLKTVPDDTGHDHQITQQQTVVSANTEQSAACIAQSLFCQAVGIIDWRMRADTYEVAELA
ncbi:MAG: hypothetical protein INR70_01470 [Parafilimonas terrae]|jgi:hypothetical protein|nr:hypothetical protein [Parafilimonas terrae]